MMNFLPLVVTRGAGVAGVLRRRLLKAAGPPLFRSRLRPDQLIDAAALHQIGADETGEGEGAFDGVLGRSEERRVGKECRGGGAAGDCEESRKDVVFCVG